MSLEPIRIGNREIGPGRPPFVICELSGNHNGSLERALKMVDAAAATGADAIKLQTYTADTLTIDYSGPGFVIEKGLWAGRRLYDLYREAHTPYEWHEPLFRRARELGILIFSTPFDSTAVELLSSLGAPAYKIASFELVDLALIARVAREGKPMILSTGMARFEEIGDAVHTAREQGAKEIMLLHCVSAYPAPVNEANLRAVPHLAARFGCLSGLSDHTHGNTAAIAAIALGAVAVEKHFTLARADGGPDSAFSLEPDEFADLVRNCRDAWASLGAVVKGAKPSERNSMVFRRSLYVVADVAAGEEFTPDNVRAIRPGYGMAPKYLSEVLGKRAVRAVTRGTPLSPALLTTPEGPLPPPRKRRT